MIKNFVRLTKNVKNNYVIFMFGIIIGAILFSGCKRCHLEGFSSAHKENNDENDSELMTEWTKNAKKYAENNMHQDHLTKNQTYSGKNNFKRDSDLFFLTETISKPECCPSTYSNSGGCLCMTPEQNDFLNKHAENSSYNKY